MNEATRPEDVREESDIEPAADGTRSDAGTATSAAGAAPKAGEPDAGAHTTPPNADLPSGDATGAGGGYGSGSAERSSGGTGDGEVNAGDDPQTDWLRDAPGGAS